jgi:hypothetical protein
MNKKLLAIGAMLALAAGAAAWYVWGPAATPAGQPPLVRLDAARFAELKEQFNRADSSVRVVALLSPT